MVAACYGYMIREGREYTVEPRGKYIDTAHTGGMDRRVRELEEGAQGKALERNLGSRHRNNKKET